LKRIFGIFLGTQDVAADGSHQPAVPPHQRLEGALIMARGELVEQEGVVTLRERFASESANLANDGLQLSRRHGGRS
jgi:hypothetical protein